MGFTQLLSPTSIETTPELPVEIELVAKRKTATAQIREGAILVQVPKHWPKVFRSKTVTQLTQQIQQQFRRDYQLAQNSAEPLLSFEPKDDLFSQWVYQINRQTFNVPLKKVRIGQAKYTHLAQMNTRTGIMTVSRYCLKDVPESALRYLVIHELAHLRVADHSKAFWSLVAEFVPDYRHQRRLISAFHRVRIYEADRKPVATQRSIFDWFKS